MPLNYPAPGFNSVNEYMVPGLPFAYTDTVTATTDITLPFISSSITVKNTGTVDLKVAFSNAPGTKCHFVLKANETITSVVRINFIRLIGGAGGAVSVLASLTRIPGSSLGALEGPGITTNIA